eukprot:CAMPEP_0202850956 /NCGR_PEP_ID=MMETSP1389-20130828/85008_1 /ASSEMBLY_ACC=CAM_ASM_000865 /TAXON_ID=302021 /ORGANISM="Rhodomonas sp., Strain CCMP768" /LENGTH=90 /DNA_ID=CAMNT_0049529205 /DNA_START=625 /DNA_END=897 /DNA_ORIENTATION=+
MPTNAAHTALARSARRRWSHSPVSSSSDASKSRPSLVAQRLDTGQRAAKWGSVRTPWWSSHTHRYHMASWLHAPNLNMTMEAAKICPLPS